MNTELFLRVLKVLRLVPADIFLDVMSRDFQFDNAEQCVVGWVVRTKLAELTGVLPEQASRWSTPIDIVEKARKLAPGYGTGHSMPQLAVALFGGTIYDWFAVYNGVLDDDKLPIIELAIVARLDELVAA